MSYFSQFLGSKYSQNGEEGILFEILKRIGTPEPGTFVEFGVGDGKTYSNTLLMAERGSRGVWIEADESSYPVAKALGDMFDGRVETLNELVARDGEKSLDNLLAKTKTPRNVDFMSIDIDSYDLEVWQSLKDYRPKVILVEINSAIPVGIELRHKSGIDSGASFTSMLNVGLDKGYGLVAHTGNLFFVDGIYYPKMGLPQSEMSDPNTIFNDAWARAAKPEYVAELLRR